jgi:phage-related tail fiber protein
MEGICHCCGKIGHLSDKCWKRNSTPEAEWHYTKEKQTAQAAARATQASEASATQQSVTTHQAPTGAASTTSSETGMVNLQVTGWSNVQFASQPKVELYHSKIAGVCAPQPQDSS